MTLICRDEHGRGHVVALSGGGDSSLMAVRLREREPRPYTYACTPTGDELPEMFAHWLRLGDMLGSRLIPIMEGHSLFEWSRLKKAIPNRKMRHCTPGLKIEPFIAWLYAQLAEGPLTVYVGLRADEPIREGGLYGRLDMIEQRHPLRDWGYTEAMVDGELEQRGIIIPERTDCARCYHQQLGEWFRLWYDHRALFVEAIDFEAEMGHTFREPKFDSDGKPVMVTRYGMTFAASSRDTWPARLADLAALFEAGHVPTVRYDPRQRDLLRAGPCRACSI